MKQSAKILIIMFFQLFVVITVFQVFIKSVPWLNSEPVSSLKKHSEMAANYPPPAWAKCYSINHRKPTYYSYSPEERPVMAKGSIFIILGGTLFLIVTGFYVNTLLKTTNNKRISILDNT